MQVPQNNQELYQSLLNFRLSSDFTELPEHTQTNFNDNFNKLSIVDQSVPTMEALYAIKEKLDTAGLTLVGQIAGYVVPLGWHGLSEDDRGLRIFRAMCRDLGEDPMPGQSWPEPENDPEPKDRYLEKEDQPAEDQPEESTDSEKSTEE